MPSPSRRRRPPQPHCKRAPAATRRSAAQASPRTPPLVISAEAVPAAGGGCGASATAVPRDIVVTRSTDAGQNFAAVHVVATSAAVFGTDCTTCSLSDPTPVGLAIDADAPLLLLATAARSPADRAAGQLDVLLWRSTDSGASWSPPVNLSAQFGGRPLPRLAGGHGIRIMNGKYAGRVVVPAVAEYGAGAPASTMLLSDDGGATWRRGTGATEGGKRGGVAEINWATRGVPDQIAPEPGDLVAFLQDDATPCDSGGAARCRWLAYSSDGGDTWGPSAPSVPDGGSEGSISQVRAISRSTTPRPESCCARPCPHNAAPPHPCCPLRPSPQWWGGRGLLSVNARSAGGNLTLDVTQDGGAGGAGSEVFARVGGAVDVGNFIWLTIAEFAGLAWETAAGDIVAVCMDPSTVV